MANPFDVRSILLARHAQHVVLIHFPIALFLTGVLLDMVSWRKPGSRPAVAAGVNLTAAVLSIFPAFATGLLAWQFALEGQPIRGALLYHLLGASVTAILIITTVWLRMRKDRTMIVLFFELAGALSLALTAHLGGFLSGVNT